MKDTLLYYLSRMQIAITIVIHFTYTRETLLEDKHALNYEEVEVPLCILYSNAIDAIGTFNRSGLPLTSFVCIGSCGMSI